LLYTAWQDPGDDGRFGDWARSNMAAMSHLATGISLADENLEPGAARQGALDLRPGWSIPQLDEPRVN
jgi:hypothetical protein